MTDRLSCKTFIHVFDFYLDNYVATKFCKVCSKEGDDLEKPCSGKYKPKDEIGIDETNQDAK